MKPKIPILDSGAQLYAAICRVCDELGVEPEYMPINAGPEKLRNYKAFIISGGPASVYQENAPTLHSETFEMIKNAPGTWKVLGICYGTQLLAHLFGGKVAPLPVKEYGKTLMHRTGPSALFNNTPTRQRVLMSHGDSIGRLPEGFETIAQSDAGLVAAIQNKQRGIYGVQFHPEAVPISQYGKKILGNFLFEISGFTPSKEQTIDDLISEQREYIRATTKPGQKIFCGLSGGVDSSVAAKITEEELGADRCIGFIIDTGGMRQGETRWVYDNLSKYLKMPIHILNAEDRFLNGTTTFKGQKTKKLCEESDSKIKRAIFSAVYQDIFGEAVIQYGLNENTDLLLQGTLRPDLIESAAKSVSKIANQIKQHHNVFDRFNKLEPNQHLHKDQVRKIAVALGLSEELAFRQPFPGPGLFPRTICAEQPCIDDAYKATSKEIKEYARDIGLEALLLPIKTVGIKGDARSDDFAVALSYDDGPNPDWEKLAIHADKIPRIVHGVNRVFYSFSSVKGIDPRRIITPTHCTKDVLDQLRMADAIVNAHQEGAGIDSRQIAQFPVSLLPIRLSEKGNRTIALRPFITEDFYTGLPAIPGRFADSEHIKEDFVKSLVLALHSVPGIGSSIMYDLTSKPPGTTELE
jgi:GMP synthase (glutamine-hydrolysing)